MFFCFCFLIMVKCFFFTPTLWSFSLALTPHLHNHPPAHSSVSQLKKNNRPWFTNCMTLVRIYITPESEQPSLEPTINNVHVISVKMMEAVKKRQIVFNTNMQ